MIVAGMGCRPGVAPEAVLALLKRAGQGLPAFTHLAAPAFRVGETSLAEAAARLGLELLWLEAPALEAVQPLCPTRSAAALRATGLASVAEACALAGAGMGASLLLPRIDGAGVTCAVAAGSSA
ncbi:cobalamin biosynthesis protein [Roseomonas aerophila]|uniref:Cobalamin biosynthesis protein n=2 Tax=Teichococcus aerophilus TaxID=1224513 RepID=A0ABR7RIF5_9PROT|nr:cobalamin biosynthesis protein [Pseudoroseomonas aerophila]